MSEFNFSSLAQCLPDTKMSGVSFEGQAKNWGAEEEAKDLIDAINNCRVLDYLNLEGNTLGVDAANGISEALKKHPELKQALWRDLFTGRLKTEIPLALKSLGQGMITACANLSILDCSDNALGPNGMTGLVDLLKSPTCYSLKELKLNNCGLGIAGGKMLAQALMECHAASANVGTVLKLKVFVAGRNRLENDGARALAKVFGLIQTLEEVSMPQNGIYHVGISALSEALKLNESMKVLNLNDNTVTARGAKHLADAFEIMQNLKEINLGDCLLKTNGAIYISEAILDGHQQLEILNLGYNEIGPEGGMAVISALENKQLLKNVTLNGNQFGSECREQIREQLVAYEKLDALGALDEDDSDCEPEDEAEGEEDEYEDESDIEESEGEYADGDNCHDDESYRDSKTTFNNTDTSLNNFSLNNLNNSNSLCFVGENLRPNTVETFCNTPNPTIAMFNALEENDKVLAFRTFIMSIPEEDYLTYLVFAILKCSAISTESNDALEVAQMLYKDCFDYAEKTNQVKRVMNFFLIQLGLLKHEEKSFQLQYNAYACQLAVKHAITQNSFPDDITNTFELFLKRVAS